MIDKIKCKIKSLYNTGFFHIFGSSVINKVITFLSSVFLIRILSKGEYGIFTYAWNIYSIVLLTNGLGVESAILQLCSEKPDKNYTDQISSYGMKIGLMFNIILCFVLLGIGSFAPLTIDGSDTLLKLLCLLPLFQLIYNLISVTLRYKKRNKEYSVLTTVNTALILCASMVGAVLFRERGLVFGYYFAYICSSIIGMTLYKVMRIERKSELASTDKKSLFSIAFVSMANNGISQLLYLIDVFVLGIVVAEETILASYKVATMIPTALTFVPLSLIIYLYPYFAEHKDDGKWCLKNYKKIVLGMGTLNFVISLTLFIFAPFVIKVFFGDIYLDAVPVFRLLSINYFISGTFRILSGNLLVTQRKLRFNLIVAIVSGLVNIIADYYFIQWWGSMGAALANTSVVIVSSFMSTSYLIITFRKRR